jgi:hypothetical protein
MDLMSLLSVVTYHKFLSDLLIVSFMYFLILFATTTITASTAAAATSIVN